jgi:hypothetical protein
LNALISRKGYLRKQVKSKKLKVKKKTVKKENGDGSGPHKPRHGFYHEQELRRGHKGV